MIQTPPNITFEAQPLEIRRRHTINSLLNRILRIYEAIYDRFGEEGLELIREVSVEYGTEIGKRAVKNKDEWTIQDIGLFLVKVFSNVYGEGEIVDFNDNRVSIKVYECVYPFRNPDICAAHTNMERALVQTLNPNMDYFIEESIPRGDSCCLHVVAPLKRE